METAPPPQPPDAAVVERKAPPLIRADKPAPRLLGPNESSGKSLAVIDLSGLHNRLWRTSLTAQLAGRTFYLSGEASDASNYHVVLTDQKSGRPTFMREMDLIMGYVDLQVAGRPYRVGIKPNLLDLYGSRLEIKGEEGTIASYPIRALMRGMFEAGQPLDDGGRDLRVHYTDQIFEAADGSVARYGEPLLVLMVEQKDGTFHGELNRFQGDAVRASDIPPGRVLRAAFKIAPYGLFYLDLRRSEDGRTLELLEPGS